MKRTIECIVAVFAIFAIGGCAGAPHVIDSGLRKDGSYFTRIEWANHTVQNPLYWVNNLNDDDLKRDSGSYGANTNGPADLILSFFGEPRNISAVKFFHNVGATQSLIEELASEINVYVSDDEKCARFGDEKADINSVRWSKVLNCKMEKKEGWFEFKFDKPVTAKYVRIELVRNFGTPPDKPWTETNEIKIYP